METFPRSLTPFYLTTYFSHPSLHTASPTHSHPHTQNLSFSQVLFTIPSLPWQLLHRSHLSSRCHTDIRVTSLTITLAQLVGNIIRFPYRSIAVFLFHTGLGPAFLSLKPFLVLSLAFFPSSPALQLTQAPSLSSTYLSMYLLSAVRFRAHPHLLTPTQPTTFSYALPPTLPHFHATPFSFASLCHSSPLPTTIEAIQN
jgi:hypothetical protein